MSKNSPNKRSLWLIVAMGVIGFAVIEFLPAGKGNPSQAASDASHSAATPNTGGLPVSLTTDPFAQGSNGEGAASSGEAKTSNPAGDPSGQSVPPGGIFGPLPAAGPWSPPIEIRSDSQGDPVKNTGANQQSEKKPDTAVELHAIVSVRKRTAFLSVNGADASPYQEGSLLGEGWRVLKIAENEVVLSNGKEKARVLVGGTTNL